MQNESKIIQTRFESLNPFTEFESERDKGWSPSCSSRPGRRTRLWKGELRPGRDG